MGKTFISLGLVLLLSQCSTSTATQDTLALQSPSKTPSNRENVKTLRILHYNIKELTTEKLLMNQPQVVAAGKVLKQNPAELISINEIQYDIENVPSQGLPGQGLNLARLLSSSGLNPENYHYQFEPANTGKKAKRLPSGEYLAEHNSQSVRYADNENFGIFPAQYSTGLASALPITSKRSIAELKWKDWVPHQNFSDYELADGSAIPRDIPLFDKNFNHAVIRFEDQDINVITFHTVPAYGFGNPKSPNAIRNAHQLEFLEWYLTGKCDRYSMSPIRRCETDIQPLSHEQPFIAMGDLNVDLKSKDPGATVMKRILENSRTLKSVAENESDELSTHTSYLGDGADIRKNQFELDYIILSNDWKIHSLKVLSPEPRFKQHDCFDEKNKAEIFLQNLALESGRVSELSYRSGEKLPYCVISTSYEFARFRQGSDHFPLSAEISLK